MSEPAVSIRPGSLIVSAGDCVAIGTADEVERFAALLIEKVWEARRAAPSGKAPQATREAAGVNDRR